MSNVITLSRIFLLIPSAIFLDLNYYSLSISLFIISALTDLIDGYIARKFKDTSMLGKLLDPLADKVLSLYAVMFFIKLNYISIYPALFILLRELASIHYGVDIILNNREIVWGKAKNLFYFFAIVTILVVKNSYISDVFIWCSVFASWVSAFIMYSDSKENYNLTGLYNLANAITLTRLLLVFPAIYFILEKKIFISIFILIFAALTDLIDGYIARRFNQETEIGAILDPLVDKFYLLSVLFSFIYLGYVTLDIVILVIIREISVTSLKSLRYYVKDSNNYPGSNWHGKVKVWAQDVLIILIIAFGPIYPDRIFYLGYILAILTILSGIKYFKGIKSLASKIEQFKY
jgi:CDP-diacylglycerol--glycerol-3-phosphate 3-phosphatidyltransferase